MNCPAAKKIIQISLLIVIAGFFFSCREKRPVDKMSDDELKAYASKLAHLYPITDGHVDLPTVLYEKGFQPKRDKDTLMRTKHGDFDYARAKAGGLMAPFMSIYVPASYQSRPDFGKSYADSLIDMVHRICSQMPEYFVEGNSPKDVEANFTAGVISLPMGMENGAPIGKDIKNVERFYEAGVQYITLTHNRDNQICDSSGDTTHTWNGLSPFGKEVVAEMNRTGIMIDISHVDDSTFYQVLALSKVPCITSHSSCRHFAPQVRRDVTDDMIRRIGKNDGVILVNFFTGFLDSAVDNQFKEDERAITKLLKEKKLTASDSLGKKLIAQYEKEHPNPPVSVSKVADHIDHVVQVAGIDHVGFGSDFDGVDELLPVGLTDVSMYPNVIYELLKRGYTEKDIEKINHGNFHRVWSKVLAARQPSATGK